MTFRLWPLRLLKVLWRVFLFQESLHAHCHMLIIYRYAIIHSFCLIFLTRLLENACDLNEKKSVWGVWEEEKGFRREKQDQSAFRKFFSMMACADSTGQTPHYFSIAKFLLGKQAKVCGNVVYFVWKFRDAP